MDTGRHDGRWERNLAGLMEWVRLTGDPMAPAGSTVTLDGEELRVGTFVAYARQRRRHGLLDPSRAGTLEAIPGWTWGSLPPGPKGNTARNEEIRQLRRDGVTLDELAAAYGMSRQRIHQIAPDKPDPERHREHLAARRAQHARRRAAERDAAAARASRERP